MTWTDDQLGRREFGGFVKNLLISRHRAKGGSFIANLDAAWGEGKTYFLNNLAEDLEGAGYPVARVNAWQDDRADDPLITVIAAMEDSIRPTLKTGTKGEKLLNEASKAIAPVAVEAGKQIGAHLLKSLIGLNLNKLIEVSGKSEEYQADDEAISAATDKILAAYGQQLFEKRLMSQRQDKAAINKFREDIGQALGTLKGEQLPMFVFIDELDRCRPLYAVRMLEEIKHIFEIKNVVFLIATDSQQLSHSIKALYGQDFDSSIYLRKFFDRVIAFPPVSRKAFVESVSKSFDIDFGRDFYKDEPYETIEVFVSLFNSVGMSNRDIAHFFEIVATFVHSWNKDVKIYAPYLAALTFDYFSDPRRFVSSETLSQVAGGRSWRVLMQSGKQRNLVTEVEGLEKKLHDTLYSLAGGATDLRYFHEELYVRQGEISRDRTITSHVKSYRERIILAGRIVETEV